MSKHTAPMPDELATFVDEHWANLREPIPDDGDIDLVRRIRDHRRWLTARREWLLQQRAA